MKIMMKKNEKKTKNTNEKLPTNLTTENNKI